MVKRVYEDRQAANIIRLLLLCGARRGEVFAMRWSDLNLTDGTWTKPASTTKQKKTHVTTGVITQPYRIPGTPNFPNAKKLGHTHLVNKIANVCWCLPPASARSGFPAPIAAEANSVSANQRLRRYNFQSLKHPGSQVIEPNKHKAVNAAKGGVARRRMLS